MDKFKSESCYHIKDRGTVFNVRCPRYIPDRDNDPWRGQIVEIDGKQYEVKGVESYALGHINEGAPIGLLVEKE